MENIRPERIITLNDKQMQQGCKYVIYRMQSSVRIKNNLALAVAIELANEHRLPLKVIYHLSADFAEANYRHFSFLAEGLVEVERSLAAKGVEFQLLFKPFEEEITALFPLMAALITDRGYLRFHRAQEEWLVKNLPCQFIRVEDNLCIPISAASHKQEWAARTIRPKIMEKLPFFRNDTAPLDAMIVPGTGEPLFSSNHKQLLLFMEQIKRKSPLAAASYRGGEQAAETHLTQFIAHKLARYDDDRNHPERRATSHLSPYLHFGMISPLTILQQLPDDTVSDPFIEELVVRRELAHNFVWYNKAYDSYHSLPEWSQKTLEAHATDKRPYLYTMDQLEEMQTHDACWNSAMQEMVTTGFMENTMRMYWGKKIIEWSETPQEAFHTMAYLNNKYELDGSDANSWAGIGWCLGVHDTAWKERPIFGTVRYMNQAGLYRKYDMKAYLAKY